MHAGAALGAAADVLEQEDECVDRLQRRERLRVERVEVILTLALLMSERVSEGIVYAESKSSPRLQPRKTATA